MAETPDKKDQPNTQDDTLHAVNWELLLDSIERQECIVCVGPGVFTEDGQTLEQRLSESLRTQKDLLRIRVYDDGWYHFLDKRQWIQTWYAIKKFYEMPCKSGESVLHDLALINFGIYISFTPDYKMKQALVHVRGEENFNFASYVKKEPYKKIETPTPQKPLVYNLLGEINVKSSIVHTYEDMYQYLESAFEGNSMPPELKEKLINAEHYLFIGMPFDRWYMHLFLHMLKQNEYEGRTKYAPSQLVLNEIEEQYNITFVPTEANHFVKELLRKCQDRGLLFRTEADTQPGPSANTPPIAQVPEIAAIKNLIIKGELDEAFADTRDFLINAFSPLEGYAQDLMNSILMEESNYNRLKRSYNRGDLTVSEFEQKVKSATAKLLEYLDDIQELYISQFPPQ